jgi:hypothetical protein
MIGIALPILLLCYNLCMGWFSQEDEDPDTETLCRNRIKRIAAANGIPAIIK